MATARLSRALPPPRINTITSRSPRGTRALTDAPLVGGSRLAATPTAGAYRPATRSLSLFAPATIAITFGPARALRPSVRRCVGYSSRKWSAPGRVHGITISALSRHCPSVVRASGEWTHAMGRWCVLRPLAALLGANSFRSPTDRLKSATFDSASKDSSKLSRPRKSTKNVIIYYVIIIINNIII